MPIPFPSRRPICDGTGLYPVWGPEGRDLAACPGCPQCPDTATAAEDTSTSLPNVA